MIKYSVIILALLLSVSGWAQAKSVTHSHAGRVHSHPLPKQGIKHQHGGGAFGVPVTVKSEKKQAKSRQSETGRIQRNLDTYNALDKRARQLWKSRTRVVLKSSRTRTFKKYPILKLIDINGDKRPDQFSYSPESGAAKMDFGFIFDRNNDGKADYLVYYQGNFPVKSTKVIKDFSELMSSVVWTFYHLIDSDYDGKIDIWVYPDVDLNQDKNLDGGVTAWLYDINQDGKIDKGEHLGRGIRKTINEEGGVLKIKCILKNNINVGDTVLLERANKMLRDINTMMD